MQSVLISGYKQAEVGIFSEKDPKIPIIKEAVRRDLVRFLENGTEWFILTGTLGFEFWCLQVLKELRSEGYAFQIASLFLFENQGENWNEANQEKLAQFKQVDFVKYAYPHYSSPQQFREYNQFLAENTDGAYLFYDAENETNLKYLYNILVNTDGYNMKLLSFDELNEVAENFVKNE